MEATRTVYTYKNVNRKQYHILGRIAKINTTTKDLKVAEVVKPPHPFSTCLSGTCRRQMVSGEKTVDFHISSYEMIPLALLFQVCFHWLNQSIYFLVPSNQLLIWQMLFPTLSVEKDYQKEFALNWQDQQYTFTDLPQDISALQPFVMIQSAGTFTLFLLHRKIMLAHHIDDNMMIGPGRQEVATTIHKLVRYLHVRGQKINPQNPGAFYFRAVSGVHQDITCKVKDKCLHLAPSP